MGDTKIPIEYSNNLRKHLLKKPEQQEKSEDPPKFNQEELNYLEKLLKYLETKDETTFLSEYNSICEKITNIGWHLELLIKAVVKVKNREIWQAIKQNLYKANYKEKYKELIAAICMTKELEVLKEIGYDFLEKEEVIIIIIDKLDKDLFDDWFDVIIGDTSSYIIPANYHNKLLDTALLKQNEAAIIRLCKSGAYLGYKYIREKKERRYLIDEIDKTVLTEIFDSCITSCNHKLSDDFQLNFNYINFVPSPSTDRNTAAAEMTAITRIVNNEDLLDLLEHPLITSYMTLRWAQISKLFLFEFICFCLYGLSMIAFILGKCEYEADVLVFYARLFAVLGIFFLIIRETMQFLRRPSRYIQKISNYLEIVLIILSVRILMSDFDFDESKITIIITVLLMAWELVFLIGYFPILSISTYILMLEEVLKTFLKSFSLYSIFILNFVLCFRVIFQKQFNNQINCDAADKDKSKECTKFHSLLPSFVKTMAMIAGELDFENLNLQNYYSYLLVLLFVICMTIVLMNLLNGLAVSDIQVIKKNAQLNGLICRAHLLRKSGQTLFKKRSDKISLFSYMLTTYPNDDNLRNKVTFSKECMFKDNETDANLSSSFLNKTFYIRQIMDALLGKCTVMDSNIVKHAMKNINNNMVRKENLNSEENNQLTKLEESIKNIEKLIKSFENKKYIYVFIDKTKKKTDQDEFFLTNS